MKIRSGFVSNSSSSSFVITGPFKDGSPKITIDLSEYGEVMHTVEEVEAYYAGQYSNPKYYKESNHYKLAIEAVKNGKAAFIGSIDNEMIGVVDFLGEEFEAEVDY